MTKTATETAGTGGVMVGNAKPRGQSVQAREPLPSPPTTTPTPIRELVERLGDFASYLEQSDYFSAGYSRGEAETLRQAASALQELAGALEKIEAFKPTFGYGEPHTQIAVFAKEQARATLSTLLGKGEDK